MQHVVNPCRVIMMGYLYIGGTILFTVYGQLILKWRINSVGELPALSSDKVLFLLKLLFDPFIFSGLLSALIASLFWMAAMTKFDISFVYPLITAGLTLITVLMAIIILREPITIYKVTGVMLIVSGVFVMMRDV